MTSITASNSTVRTLMNAKPSALTDLTAARRVTLAAPVAPTATTAPPDSKDAVTSPATSTPSVSLGTILTLQDATASDPDVRKPAASNQRLTLADLNGQGANLINLQTRTSIGTRTVSLVDQSPQSLLKLVSA